MQDALSNLSFSGFVVSLQSSVESNFAIALALHCSFVMNKISSHFLNQSEVRTKPIVACPHAFSRAYRRLYVFVASSDWLIGLSASVVIGQSNHRLRFWFYFTQLKTALSI